MSIFAKQNHNIKEQSEHVVLYTDRMIASAICCIYLVSTSIVFPSNHFTVRITCEQRIDLCRGVYPPWVVEANPPEPPNGDGPRIHALYLSQVGVLEREEKNQSYEIIIEGAKHPRIKNRRRRGEKSEKFEIYPHKPWTQTMQWFKWFINNGEVLLTICHPAPSLHTTHIFLSSLSSLLKQLSLGTGRCSLISSSSWDQGCASSPAIFMHFRLKLSHLVQYK